jgi:hypothetical protein
VKRDIAASGLIAIAGCVAQIPRSERPSLADTATPFTLSSQDRTPFSLAPTLGSDHVVIVFYRGHW